MKELIKMFGTADLWFDPYFKINLVRITGTYVHAMCQMLDRLHPPHPCPAELSFVPLSHERHEIHSVIGRVSDEY